MPTAVPVLRLFVALRPAAAWRDLLARAVRRVGEAAPRARLVRAENVHLTLVFLGATPAPAVPGIEAALREAARRVAPFPWRVAGLGAFPSPHRPRVVWAGVDPDVGAADVAALAARVREALAATVDRARGEDDGPAAGGRAAPGDAGDERFHPHLTLARLDPPQPTPALTRLLTPGTLQDTYKPEVASDLALMVSENDGSGVRYRALATVPLGAVDTPRTEGASDRA